MSSERILRDRQARAAAAAERRVPFAEDGAVAMLAQTTTTGNYPTVPGTCFACVPALVDGPETEGATPAFSTGGSGLIFAFNLGSHVPPLGTTVIVHACGGRWVFRYDG
jgi:hypothetical protein